MAGTLLLIYTAYLIWDVLDVWMARKDDGWRRLAGVGAIVTLVFAILSAVIFAAVRLYPAKHDHAVLWWNLVLVALVYGYRVAQEKSKTRFGGLPPTSSPGL